MVSYLLLPVHVPLPIRGGEGPAGAGAGKVTYSGHNHLTKPVASSQAPGERWRLAAALRMCRDQSLGSRGPGGSWVVVSCGGRVAAAPSIQLYLQPPPQLVLPISSQSIAMLHTLRLCVCCQATRLETKICPLLSTMWAAGWAEWSKLKDVWLICDYLNYLQSYLEQPNAMSCFEIQNYVYIDNYLWTRPSTRWKSRYNFKLYFRLSDPRWTIQLLNMTVVMSREER